MNAHSNIKGDKRGFGSTNVRLLHSKAFRSGFIRGFGAPTLFFVPRTYPRTSRVEADVVDAWKAVRNALSEASTTEVKRIGKAARKVATAK